MTWPEIAYGWPSSCSAWPKSPPAGALGAVAEVVADHQPFDVQAFDQHFFGEFLRRQRGERRREVLDDDAVDAVVGQRLQLVAQVGDARRRARQIARALGKEFARMRFERHHGRFQAEAAGGRAHTAQQGLVAEVDAVEIADRERAGRTRRCIGKTAKYLHGNLGGNLSLNRGLYGLFHGFTPGMGRRAVLGGVFWLSKRQKARFAEANRAFKGRWYADNYIGWLIC